MGSIGLLPGPGIERRRALHEALLAGPQPATQTGRWHRAWAPAFAEWAEHRQRSRATQRMRRRIAMVGTTHRVGTQERMALPTLRGVRHPRAFATNDAWMRAQDRGE